MPDVNDDSLKRLIGDQPIITSASVRIRQDEQTLASLERHFVTLRREAERIAKYLKEAGVAMAALNNFAGGSTTNKTRVGNTNVELSLNTPDREPTKVITDIDSANGGRGGRLISKFVTQGEGGPQLTRLGGTVMYGAQALGAVGQAMDARIERGYQYSLSADRMNMLFQQMKGMSQQAIQDSYRQPLTQYKLGAGGINSLLALEAGTGISASKQAASVEAMRVSSGFSISAQQAANTIEQLASPQVANRMFMMTGMSLVKPGGGYRSMNEVLQNLVQSQGLLNPKVLQGALAPGSVTRANLTNIGVSGDLQTQLLQYAQQNLAFRQKGGTGMYDPSNKAHQKIMGIDSNFAMQQEESDRLRTAREEQFYSRQADNFADLEKQTQSLIRAMAGLEDTMSGIFGFKTSTKVASGIGGAIGTVLGGLLGNVAFPGVGGTAGAMAGNQVGQFAGQLITRIGSLIKGDPPASSDLAGAHAAIRSSRFGIPASAAQASRNAVTSSGMGSGRPEALDARSLITSSGMGSGRRAYATGGGQGGNLMREIQTAYTKVYNTQGNIVSLADFVRDPALLNSNPEMVKSFVSAAIAANQEGTIIGINSGWRSEAEQYKEFMSRYKPVGYKTDVLYRGQYYELQEGKSPVAVPGSPNANHQHGVAFDASGDVDWLAKNARRFGLSNYASAGEPWHFQLTDAYNNGSQYNERTGFNQEPISYGSYGIGYDPKVKETKIIDALALRGLQSVKWTKSVGGRQQQVGIEFLPTSAGGTLSRKDANEVSKSFGMYSDMGMLGLQVGGQVEWADDKHITVASALRLAQSSGWVGEEAVKAVSIARRESGLQPGNLNSHNEYSIGLYQINVKDKANLAFLTSLGYKPEDLYDPRINTIVAHAMYMNNLQTGGNGWTPWGPYKHMHEMTSTPWESTSREALRLGIINTPYAGPQAYDGMIPYKSLKEWEQSRNRQSVPSTGANPFSLGNIGDPAPTGRGRAEYTPSLGNNTAVRTGGPTIVGNNQATTVVGGPTITVSPTVNITASSGNLDQDLEKMARKVAALLEREVNRTMMRRN